MALSEIDRKLIERCLLHEAGAWRDFVKRFMGLFLHVINHTLHAHSVRVQADEIDDLCSDVFVQILANEMKALREFSGKSSLASYLTVIARRTTLKSLLKRHQTPVVNVANGAPESIEDRPATPNTYGQDDLEEIEALMKKLPPEHAAIIKMFYLDSLSYQEIQQKTGIAASTIGSILSRSRAKLNKDNLQV